MRRLLVLALLASGCVPRVSDSDDDTATTPHGPPGPVADAGPDRAVLGGLRVPLDASQSYGGTFVWTQTAGTPLAITTSSAGMTAYVQVPATAAPGDAWTFHLSVTRDEIVAEDDVTVTAKAAVFEDFLAAITDTAQLNVSEGLDFDASGMWVLTTNPGFVSLFSTSGAFVVRRDLPGTGVGSNFRADGKLVVALGGLQRVDAFDVSNATTTTITSQDADMNPLGPVNYPLPDANGNVFVSNRAGLRVFRYDAATDVTRVFLVTTSNVNALAFGPEPGVLYAGLATSVLRVPINGDGTAGTPQVYATGFSEVDGIEFDVAGNMWIGCPNTNALHVVPYVAGGPSAIARSFPSVGGNIDVFTNVQYGTAPYGGTTLYWTNLGKRSVGRLDTGLPPLLR